MVWLALVAELFSGVVASAGNAQPVRHSAVSTLSTNTLLVGFTMVLRPRISQEDHGVAQILNFVLISGTES
jgi:hypothetical protein